MRILFLNILLLLSAFVFGQHKKHVYQDKKIKVEYHTRNGLFDGKYVSHYPNGHKMAEGNLKDNLRIGKWDIWDSTGKIHIEHVVTVDSLTRNKDGYFNYTPLKENDIVVMKRVWRNVYKEKNPVLFNNPDLYQILYDLIQTDSLVLYRDEEFQNARTKSDIKLNFSGVRYEVISYRVKEDWFFDETKNKAEVRIVGLYPILRQQETQDEESIGFGWLYYPALRKVLAKQEAHEKHNPAITNLDEVFLYRHFTSQIYKELNVFDRSIAAYTKTAEEAALEAERIEIDMIETEHLAWLFGRKPFSDTPGKK